MYGPSCGDLMYSGHNASTILLMIIALKIYTPIISKNTKYLLFAFYGFLFVVQAFLSLLQRM